MNLKDHIEFAGVSHPIWAWALMDMIWIVFLVWLVWFLCSMAWAIWWTIVIVAFFGGGTYVILEGIVAANKD